MTTDSTMDLLVFDDDDAIGRLVVRVAAIAGWQAVAVADVQAFHQQLQDRPPQMIVLDLQLDDTDGVEQLRLLAGRQYAGMLILISGFDTRVLETARILGQKSGLKIVGGLQKPLQMAEFQSLLQRSRSESSPLSVQHLRQAIADDELSLEFQPIVTRNPRKLEKLEALVRWDLPNGGQISASEFVPVAEADSLTIDALTEWVIGAVVEAYHVLSQTAVTVPVAINLSARNLHDLNLPDRIGDRLRAGDVPAQHICLEITETAAFADAARSMDILSRMRLKGMSLSIDDFGTGYSSLKLLHQMPFCELKVDQSFVRDLATSRDSRAIVKAIGDLAANMGLDCVAEGVETEETAELLEQMGIRHLQGYHIARPMPVEAVAAWHEIWLRSRPGAPPAETDPPAAATEPPPAAAPETNASLPELTPRQMDVMRVLSDGYSVKEIARRLDLSPSTVKVHLALAYSALKARNRVEAVLQMQPILRRLSATKD
jgi:EAL domain-containing protein (putative c-di-GMP-specific phosphodiesterase class I)/DNA-binding NarL/FixJ family response regulator